jgi:hypothetical protein
MLTRFCFFVLPILATPLLVLTLGCGAKAIDPAKESAPVSQPITAAAKAPAAPEVALPAFNQLVLADMARFPTDGTHSYWWPRAGESDYDGVTRDILFDGKRVLKGEPGGRTFCCGLTLEVFANALEKHRQLNPSAAIPLRAADWSEFKRLWFVTDLNGPGPSQALERYGLGKTITADEVLPGDFVQLWRTNKSGHSVIFLDWLKANDGTIIGMKYWSTQTSTQGIGETIEHFVVAAQYGVEGMQKNPMVPENMHYARVVLPPG